MFLGLQDEDIMCFHNNDFFHHIFLDHSVGLSVRLHT